MAGNANTEGEEWHLWLRVGCRPERLTKMRFCSFRNSPAALPPKRRLRSAGGLLCRQIALLAYLLGAARGPTCMVRHAAWMVRSRHFVHSVRLQMLYIATVRGIEGRPIGMSISLATTSSPIYWMRMSLTTCFPPLTDSAIWAADCFSSSDLANPLNCTLPLNVSTLIFAKLTPPPIS